MRAVEIGVPKDWVNGSWPICPKCGAEFVLVRGLSSIGDVQMCSKPLMRKRNIRGRKATSSRNEDSEKVRAVGFGCGAEQDSGDGSTMEGLSPSFLILRQAESKSFGPKKIGGVKFEKSD